MQFVKCSVVTLLAIMQLNIAKAQVKEHTIVQGETLSAIAVKYNTTVGDIMRFNGMNAKSQLNIGQKIKIPNGPVAATTNTPTAPSPTTTKVAVINDKAPITHTVVKGDNMYRLTKTYNVSDVQLRSWNNMQDNNIQIGQLLVVGGVSPNYKAPISSPDIVKVAEPASNRLPGQTDNPNINVIEEKKPSDIVKVAEPVKNNPSTGVVVEEKKPSDIVKVAEPASNRLPGQTNDPTEKKVGSTLPETPVYKEPEVVNGSDRFVGKEGFFAQYFERRQIDKNTTSGEAGIFKSVSGWTDKKYYVLINDIAPGTIVRVTGNGKSICAKVLGPLPSMKDDNGLKFRISNAAQNVLGLDNDRFSATINF